MPFSFDRQDISPIPGLDANPEPGLQGGSYLNPGQPDILTGPLSRNPDEEARLRNLSRQTGTSVEAVRENPDTVEAEIKRRDIEAEVQDTPVTQEWLSNPENLSFTHDIVGELSTIERITNAFSRGKIQRELTKAATDYRADRSPATRIVIQDIQARLQALGQDSGEGFTSWLTAAAEVVGQQVGAISDPELYRETVRGAMVGGLGGTFMAGPPGAVAGAGAGAIAGFTSYMAMDAFEQNGGEAYINLLEKGVDPDVAANISIGVGIANAALDMVGMGLVLKPIAEAGKTVFRRAVLRASTSEQVVSAAKRFAYDYGTGVAGEVFTEGLQEVVQITGEQIARKIDVNEIAELDFDEATARVTEVMVETFKAMALLGLPGPSAHYIVNKKQAAAAKQDYENMQKLKAQYESGTLFQRDSEKAAEHLTQVLEEAEINNVYIPGQAVREWLEKQDDPETLVHVMGIKDQLDDSLVLETDITISAENFAKYILPSSSFADIEQVIKYDEAGMSMAEAAEVEKLDLETLGSEDMSGLIAVDDPQQEQTAYSLGLKAMFNSADEAGMTFEEYKAYLIKVQGAAEESQRRAADRELKVLADTNAQVMKEKRQKIEAEVTESVNTTPVYAAINGIGRERLDADKVVAIIGADKVKQLPTQSKGRMIVSSNKKEGLIDPEFYAAVHGYDDAKSMLEDMLTAPKKEAVIARRVNERVAAEMSELRKERDNILELRKAMLNDSVADVLLTEINAMRKAQKEKLLRASVIVNAAKQRLGQTKIKDISVRKFLNAQTKFAKLAGKSIRSKKPVDNTGDMSYETEEAARIKKFDIDLIQIEGNQKSQDRSRRYAKEVQGLERGSAEYNKLKEEYEADQLAIKTETEARIKEVESKDVVVKKRDFAKFLADEFLNRRSKHKTSDLLKELIDRTEDTDNKELAEALLNFVDAGFTTTFIYDLSANYAGLAEKNNTTLNSARRGLNEDTFLHEVVHNVTVALLDADKEQTPAKKELQRLYKRTLDYLSVNDKQRQELSDDILNLRTLNNRYLYGITNIKEFITEALTNKSFQDLLKKIPAEEKTKYYSHLRERKVDNIVDDNYSIWDNLLQIISSFFEDLSKLIKNTKPVKANVLDKVLTIRDDLFRENQEYQSKAKDSHGSFQTRFKELQSKLDESLEQALSELRAAKTSEEKENILAAHKARVKALGEEFDKLNQSPANLIDEGYAVPEGITANRTQAIGYKYMQLLNFEMAKQAARTQERIEKRKKYMAKFLKNRKAHRSMHPDYLQAIRDLLAGVSFERTLNKGKKTGLENAPEPVEDTIPKKNYQEMTLDEFNALFDKVKEIHHKGVQANKFRRTQDKNNVQYVSEILAQQVVDNLGTQTKDYAAKQRSRWEQVKAQAKELGTLLFNMETVTRLLDGNDPIGIAYNYLKKPYDLAMTKGYLPGHIGYVPRQSEVAKRMKELFSVYSKKQRMNFKKERHIPGMSRKVTHEQMLAVLLNSGNDDNFMAMVDSGTFTPGEIQAIQDAASETDWKFAQSVWDYLDEFWPEISESEARRKNIMVQKVQPLEVRTKYGTFKGGYYPIKYDKKESAIVSDENIERWFNDVKFGNVSAMHVRASHKQQRVGRPKDAQYKVSLDLFTLAQHVDAVIYDLEVGDAIIDIYKVIHNRAFKNAMVGNGFVHYWEFMDVWLRDIVTGEITKGHAVEQSLKWVRNGITISSLAWNVGTMLQQPLGLLTSAAEVGSANIAKGIFMFLRNPLKLSRTVNALSPLMAHRDDVWHKDIIDAQKILSNTWVDKWTPGQSARWIKDSFFYGIKKMQRPVDLITWAAAQQKGLKDFNGDIEKAIEYADRTVVRSQASGIFGDRTPFERGSTFKSVQQTELVKLFTPMISFFIARTNITIEKTKKTNFKNPAKVMAWMWDMALLYVIEAAIMAAVAGTEDDEENPFWWRLAKNTTNGVFAGFPIIRDFAGAARGFPTGGTIASAAAEFGKLADQVSQKEFDQALVKSANNLGGIFLHYPSRQINKFIHWLNAEEQSEDDSFVRMIMGPKFQ